MPSAPEDVRAASGAELVPCLRLLGERLDDAQAVVVLAAVLGGAQHEDGMQHLRQTVLAQIVDSLRPAVTAAVARGRLCDDVVAETFAMTTVGPLFYQRLLGGARLGDDTVGRGGGCGAAGVGAITIPVAFLVDRERNPDRRPRPRSSPSAP
ncbi:TetR/AcrR family transcriptional regulator C-terminal ligand-binding domain-containing protein [Streptomyces sp. NPDC101152]|uniref:TetR/AcrR family transcriptional regulator C-terminal ligand-binding domain-containing protein n=1 Tax=Streptomyces sp. NPDC101152 TaxID=3366116 RepID=UPI0037F9836D